MLARALRRLSLPARPAWRDEGMEPDYRFSLANERTFLAWIRTGLALLAGGLALEQFADRLGPRSLVRAAAVWLIAVAAGIFMWAYMRWRANEHAMRLSQPLPHSRVLPLLAAGAALTAVALASLLFR